MSSSGSEDFNRSRSEMIPLARAICLPSKPSEPSVPVIVLPSVSVKVPAVPPFPAVPGIKVTSASFAISKTLPQKLIALPPSVPFLAFI